MPTEKSVLAEGPVNAVLPAEDADRAKAFYRDGVGLEVEDLTPGYFWVFGGEGTRFLVFQRERTKAEHTVAGFSVKDLEAVVADLRGRGVVFLEYDQPGLKTVNAIADQGPVRSAWFADTEGNIVGITQGM